MTPEKAVGHIAFAYKYFANVSPAYLTRIIQDVVTTQTQTIKRRDKSALAIREAELRSQARTIGRLRHRLAKKRRRKCAPPKTSRTFAGAMRTLADT